MTFKWRKLRACHLHLKYFFMCWKENGLVEPQLTLVLQYSEMNCRIFLVSVFELVRVRLCVFFWRRGGWINRCRICHGDICVPWRSSRVPLHLCNLQLSALTPFRPPLVSTTRPARPKGGVYERKGVRKIERGVQKWRGQRAAGEGGMKRKKGCGRNEASMGNRDGQKEGLEMRQK